MTDYFLIGTGGDGQFYFVDTEKGTATALSTEAEDKLRKMLGGNGPDATGSGGGRLSLAVTPNNKVVDVVFNKRSTLPSGQQADAIWDLLVGLA